MKPIAPITLSELISRVDALSRSRLDMKTGGAAAASCRPTPRARATSRF